MHRYAEKNTELKCILRSPASEPSEERIFQIEPPRSVAAPLLIPKETMAHHAKSAAIWPAKKTAMPGMPLRNILSVFRWGL